MKYEKIERYAGKVAVQKACALLEVRRQGYYEWRLRRESPRQTRDEALTARIQNIFFESKRIYGARKIVELLARQGIHAGRRRVRRLMLRAGLVPVTFKRFVHTTDSRHSLAIFPDLLHQTFRADALNRVWVSDMTYIPTDEGWLYLCTVLDICSRRVVGWAVSKTIDRQLAISALESAICNRRPAHGWILHSDRGCQYASYDFRSVVAMAGGIQSMSRPGSPYDNACAESFFRSLKVECLDTMRFASREKANRAIAEYMLFYNRRRVHASLGYLTPLEFELRLTDTALTT